MNEYPSRKEVANTLKAKEEERLNECRANIQYGMARGITSFELGRTSTYSSAARTIARELIQEGWAVRIFNSLGYVHLSVS